MKREWSHLYYLISGEANIPNEAFQNKFILTSYDRFLYGRDFEQISRTGEILGVKHGILLGTREYSKKEVLIKWN